MAFALPLAMIASAGSAAIGAYGSMESGAASQSMYNYQSAVAQMRAQVAKQNADYEFTVGGQEATQSGRRTAFQIGQTRAIEGAGNLDVNVGSAKEVQASEREIGQENEAIIRQNAARRAYGYQVEAATDVAQSNLYRMAGAQAKTAGEIGAVSSILGGAESVSGKWLQYGQAVA